MKFNMKKSLALVLALVMVFALAACGGSMPSASTAPDATAAPNTSSDTNASTNPDSAPGNNVADAEHMNIELTTAPVGVHPLKTNDAPSQYLNCNIYETLYRRTVDGTSFEPLLAESLPEFSEDGLSATIHLRKNVTFQDGTPFTSADVAYLIDSLKNPDYGSQRPSIVESIVSYECPDDNTIVLSLAYNDGVLIAKLAHANGAIVNSTLEKQGQDFMINAQGAGTGAYSFVSMVSGASYELAAYEDYWGGAAEVKSVSYSVVPDENTAVNRLKTNEADFAPVLLTDSFNSVNSIEGYTTMNTPASQVYYMACRSDDTSINPLMANPDFRKAILESIDWQTYCDAMLDGMGTHSESIVGPTLVGYTEAMESTGCGYNPEDAKAIVEANGWAGETVTLLTATRAWQQNCAVFIQAELAKIGLNVTIKAEEWAAFLSDAKTNDFFDFVILSWSNVTGDGQQMLEPNFSSKNGLRVQYNNAEFDSYVDASAKTTVMAERQQYMLQAVEKIQGDYIVRPVYSQNQIYCYNSTKYSNVRLDMGGEFYLKDITINK